MLKVKQLFAITLSAIMCTFASTASAQPAPNKLNAAPLDLSSTPQSDPKTAGTVLIPARQTSPKRIVKRISEPVRAQAVMQKNVYGQTIQANSAKEGLKTRFIYNRANSGAPMPVYFSQEDAVKSK